MPVAWSDAVLYASVARALQITGHPVPLITHNTPYAVDHVAFYGPVFFELTAWSFHAFGFSMRSARLVSLFGALLAAGGGAALADAMGASRTRQWLAAAVLLLTPELGDAATNGRMDALAVGLAIASLALLARALTREAPSPLFAAAAGTTLALAGLTTPRALPFVLAVTLSGVTLAWAPPERRRAMLVTFAAAVGTCAALMLAWTGIEHGSPVRWLRYLAFIATREDSDVAMLPQPCASGGPCRGRSRPRSPPSPGGSRWRPGWARAGVPIGASTRASSRCCWPRRGSTLSSPWRSSTSPSDSPSSSRCRCWPSSSRRRRA